MVKFLSKALSTLSLRKRAAKTPKRRRPAKPKNAKPSVDSASAQEEPILEIKTIESLEDELVESPLSTSKERSGPVAAPVEVAPRGEVVEPVGVDPMTADRRALIREAMAVQRSKSQLLNELSPEQRKKLRILAGKMLLGE